MSICLCIPHHKVWRPRDKKSWSDKIQFKDLTFLCVQYTNIEMFLHNYNIMNCWWWLPYNGVLEQIQLGLPKWQPWANLVICINPRWPPVTVWKINFNPLALEWCIIRLCMGYQVWRIHVWCYVFNLMSRSCQIQDCLQTALLNNQHLNYLPYNDNVF